MTKRPPLSIIFFDFFFFLLSWAALDYSQEFFEGYPWFFISWAVGHFLLIYTFEFKQQQVSIQDWIYNRRWDKSLFMLIVPLIVFQIPLTYWLWIEVLKDTSVKSIPSVMFTLPLWPLMLNLWFIRDKNKEMDIQQKAAELNQAKIETNQSEFHQIQIWAANPEESLPLRIAAIYQIKPYLTGESVSDPEFSQKFQIAAIELIKAILLTLPDPYWENEYNDEPSPEDLGNEPEDNQDLLEDSPLGVLDSSPERKAKFTGTAMREAIANVLSEFFEKDKEFMNDKVRSSFDLLDVNFREMAFVRPDFFNICLNQASFIDANMEGARFDNCPLRDACFVGTYLKDASFSLTVMWNTSFVDAKLIGAFFRSADLSNGSLVSSDVEGANFYLANLMEADLENLHNWQKIQDIRGANIKGVKNAPEGFIEWAMQEGAIEVDWDQWHDISWISMEAESNRGIREVVFPKDFKG